MAKSQAWFLPCVSPREFGYRKSQFLCYCTKFPAEVLSTVQSLHAQRKVENEPPEVSLAKGHWVKLICGASFEDVIDVRNLSLIYSLAGVDCIDCAADPAVISAVIDGIDIASKLTLSTSGCFCRPWIMISINDDEDVHFRKAEFDPRLCPPDCSRPCEQVCPASAIYFETNYEGGVIPERCYGCGRCIPICPIDNIKAKFYTRNAVFVAGLLENPQVQALEIHTAARNLKSFEKLVTSLSHATDKLKLIAVSVPDLGDTTVASMWSMYSIMQPSLSCLNLWQLDGRPMSGDIGKGTAKAAVDLTARVLASPHRPPGYLQLAGGTNSHTVEAMKLAGIYKRHSNETSNGPCYATVAGVAFGGYARKIIRKTFKEMMFNQNDQAPDKLLIEEHFTLFKKALDAATQLVMSVKHG